MTEGPPRVTFDPRVNAAYIWLSPHGGPRSAHMRHLADLPVGLGAIQLDFDAQGQLIGIEILDATDVLPPALIAQARRMDAA